MGRGVVGLILDAGADAAARTDAGETAWDLLHPDHRCEDSWAVDRLYEAGGE